jgi:hypothetical protein
VARFSSRPNVGDEANRLVASHGSLHQHVIAQHGVIVQVLVAAAQAINALRIPFMASAAAAMRISPMC